MFGLRGRMEGLNWSKKQKTLYLFLIRGWQKYAERAYDIMSTEEVGESVSYDNNGIFYLSNIFF